MGHQGLDLGLLSFGLEYRHRFSGKDIRHVPLPFSPPSRFHQVPGQDVMSQASLRDASALHGSAGLYVSPERERNYARNIFGAKIDTCVIAELSGEAPLDQDGSEDSLLGFFARRTRLVQYGRSLQSRVI